MKTYIADIERALYDVRDEDKSIYKSDAGLTEEVRGLLQSGLPSQCQAMQAIGYKELVPYIRGECSLGEAVGQLKLNTRHYAKRQLTWMRREENVLWVDALADNAYEILSDFFAQGDTI